MSDNLDDDGKLRQRYYNKQTNAAKEGVSFELTYVQYCKLLRKAGIGSSQCGIRGYHLARHADKGAYAVGNCFFVHYIENLQAKKISNSAREASSRNIKIVNDARMHLSKAERAARSASISTGIRNSAYYTKRLAESALLKQIKLERQHKSYVGSKNSQYGTFWITDGVNTQKWSKSKGRIPKGFIKGRSSNN